MDNLDIFQKVSYKAIGIGMKYELYVDLEKKKITYIGNIENCQKDSIYIDLSQEDIIKLKDYLKVNDYEKFRNFEDTFNFKKGFYGYRDGWYIKFTAISNNKDIPIFEQSMHCIYNDKYNPPYEKLLSYIRNTYFSNKKYHINL